MCIKDQCGRGNEKCLLCDNVGMEGGERSKKGLIIDENKNSKGQSE